MGFEPAATHSLPDECFVFAYFEVNGEDGLRLAWSRDGLKWDLLQAGRSFLAPTVGEAKLMRDPCLLLGPDGVFRLLWTTSWAGRTIGYASSTDLLHWSQQKAIPVMEHEEQAQNCWAPELIWDAAQEHYLIFWSTTILGHFPETELSNTRPERNHRIYSCTTRDFESFTPTRLHYDGGFNVIDASLVPHGHEWLMFVKNETVQPNTEKNIRLIRAQTPDGPFGPASPPITGDYWAEGPSALWHGDELWVYFDKHRIGTYGLVRSRDLQHWEDASDQIAFPRDARHGSVLRVPSAILKPLLEL